MLGLDTAVMILGIVIGCCIFLSLGAYLAKKNSLYSVLKTTGFIALAVLIIYVIYVAWYTLTSPK